MKQNFQKNKVVTGKTPFLWQVHFVVIILFVLTLAFDMAVFYGNDAFTILVLSKTVLQFFEKVFRFPENMFESTENLQNCHSPHWLSHKNMPISRTERYFENL